MKNAGNMAFIHFQKNYTKDLTRYIDDRENFDAEHSTYIHLTEESKFKIRRLNGHNIFQLISLKY